MVVNCTSLSSSCCSFSAAAISGMSCRPAPHTSARAASTHTGEARNATTPSASIMFPAARRLTKSPGSGVSPEDEVSAPPTCSMRNRSVVSTRF